MTKSMDFKLVYTKNIPTHFYLYDCVNQDGGHILDKPYIIDHFGWLIDPHVSPNKSFFKRIISFSDFLDMTDQFEVVCDSGTASLDTSYLSKIEGLWQHQNHANVDLAPSKYNLYLYKNMGDIFVPVLIYSSDRKFPYNKDSCKDPVYVPEYHMQDFDYKLFRDMIWQFETYNFLNEYEFEISNRYIFSEGKKYR
jgi:hypothetical protein